MTQETRAATTRKRWLSTTVLAVAGALGVAGCSSVPDAVNPVSWYRGASDAVGGMFGGDEAEAGTAAGDPGTSANTAYPNLATVPGRPTPSTTPEQREALKQGLIADRANARYTDAPAGAQSARASAAPQQRNQPQPQPKPAEQQAAVPVRSQPTAPTASPPTAAAPPVAAAPPPAAPPPGAPPAAPPPAASAAVTAPAARSTAGGSGLWPNRPPPETPGLRPSTTGRVGGDEIHRSAAASSQSPVPAHVPAPTAPPPPSAPAAASRLAERTTYDSAGAGTGVSAQPARSQPAVPPPASPEPARPRVSEQSVIVNEDAIAGSVPVAPQASAFGGRRYLASTIYFGHGSASMTAAERQEVARIGRAAAANGAAIQVIGHASARTADLSLRDHETANLAMSMKRAQTVADVLIQAGMPASRVIVEALSDSQPEFYEVMPAGEAGNRRAEIIVIY